MTRARWSLAAVSLAYMAAAAVMFGTAMPAVIDACGEPPLDGRFSWSAADAAALVDACGSTGLEAYRSLAILDLVYPALLATFLVAWTLALVPVRSLWSVVLIVPALVSAAADYAENVGVWAVLHDGAAASAPLLDIAGIAAVAKNVSGAVAFAALGAAAVWALVAWRRGHGDSMRTWRPPPPSTTSRPAAP